MRRFQLASAVLILVAAVAVSVTPAMAQAAGSRGQDDAGAAPLVAAVVLFGGWIVGGFVMLRRARARRSG